MMVLYLVDGLGRCLAYYDQEMESRQLSVIAMDPAKLDFALRA